MTEDNFLIYDVEPHHHSEFDKCLKEITNFLWPEVYKNGLKIVKIEPIYDDYDQTIFNYLKVEFSRAEDSSAQTYSENLLEPIDDTILRIYTNTKQREVDSQKSLEERREKSEKYTENGGTIQINGKSVQKPEIQVTNPENTKQKTKKEEEDIPRLSMFDIERARVSIGNKWVNIHPQIGEEIREFIRQFDWSEMMDKTSLNYSDLSMVLDKLNIGIKNAIKILNDPLSRPGNDEDSNA